MAITPSSKIRFLNVPFDSSYTNVVYWSNKSQQTATLMNRTRYAVENYSYQRKDSVIRVGVHVDMLMDCNYVMYQNVNYTDKWFYAFIVKTEYINDNVTAVYIETDVYNTYVFDHSLLASFVEREHTNDDTVGKNTVPEGLELGEYTCRQFNIDQHMTESSVICIAATSTPEGVDIRGGYYAGIFSGVGYFMYRTTREAIEALKQYDSNADGSGVQSVFMVPGFMYKEPLTDSDTIIDYSIHNYEINIKDEVYSYGEYEIKNNKLFTYPYRCLAVSNNQGSGCTLHYEKFERDENGKFIIKFQVIGTVTPGCSIRCFPLNYNNVIANYDEGINLGKFPICNWSSDVYTNWLTQNAVNIGVDVASGASNTITSFFEPRIVDKVRGATNGLSQIGHTIGEMYSHAVLPPQSKGNINCGDVTSSYGVNTFCFYGMSIKEEYAKIIDDFFSMYGYKTSQVKIPNMNHRKSYWFIKTINCHIKGNLPNDILSKLISIYDNGVTFWRNIDSIGVYDVDNSILK